MRLLLLFVFGLLVLAGCRPPQPGPIEFDDTVLTAAELPAATAVATAQSTAPALTPTVAPTVASTATLAAATVTVAPTAPSATATPPAATPLPAPTYGPTPQPIQVPSPPGAGRLLYQGFWSAGQRGELAPNGWVGEYTWSTQYGTGAAAKHVSTRVRDVVEHPLQRGLVKEARVPSAMAKTTAGVLVSLGRRLNNAIQAHELGHDQLAHTTPP